MLTTLTRLIQSAQSHHHIPDLTIEDCQHLGITRAMNTCMRREDIFARLKLTAEEAGCTDQDLIDIIEAYGSHESAMGQMMNLPDLKSGR